VNRLNGRRRLLTVAPPLPPGSCGLTTPSPPAEKATACQDQARQASAYNGAGDSSQWAPDLTTAEIHSVDVKVCRSAFESRNQARLGLRDTA
jgi:hypothetical protein